MKDFFDSLNGKRVLITGSSRGIGKAMAIGFAKCGASVIVHGIKESNELMSTLEEVKSFSPQSVSVCGDLLDKDAVENIYRDAVEKLGGVDILICNASIQIKTPWLEVTYEEAEKQLQVNFLSTLRLIQLCVTDMTKNGWGRVVTIGSVQEVKPHPDMLVYSASKSALVNMVKSLALQVADKNITVNNVAPGTIYTDRNIKALSNEDYHEKVKNETPMKKIGEPEDCVGLTLMLCTDACSFITGEDIFIDGGKHI